MTDYKLHPKLEALRVKRRWQEIVREAEINASPLTKRDLIDLMTDVESGYVFMSWAAEYIIARGVK